MVQYANQPRCEAELAAVHRSIDRGQPYGGDVWRRAAAAQFGLELTFRPRGGPKNAIVAREWTCPL